MRTRPFLLSLVLFLAVPLLAAGSEVVTVAPDGAPLIIEAVDAVSALDGVTYRIILRNRSAEPTYDTHVQLLFYTPAGKFAGSALFKTSAGVAARATRQLEVPAIRLDADYNIVAIPAAVSRRGDKWEIPKGELRRFAADVSTFAAEGIEHAVLRSNAPQAQLVQLTPPACTLAECRDAEQACYEGCLGSGGLQYCSYCDRRRVDEVCSSVCYCFWEAQPWCPPNPYH